SKNDCAISDIQLGRFKSDITIIDSWSLQTDLFTEIDEVMAFIKKHLMVEYVITGEPQHQERFDYPLNAIREIVINRVVHRDYRDSSASIIKIFDDRIEFFNPGKLFGGLTLKDLTSNNETSRARNKLIARAFKEVGLIEQYGSGIKRIIIYYKNHGIGLPKFEEVFEGFRVTLYKQVSDKVTESNIKFNTDKLSANQRQISNIINDNKDFTTSKLAEIIGISQRKIKENIAKLKVTGVLKRIGSAKGGYWIMEDQSNKIRNN
ncbi:MAG: transcriptional regulator, partial [Flavobacteriales bacterium CG_4_8_14_3_um_filter_35_10]